MWSSYVYGPAMYEVQLDVCGLQSCVGYRDVIRLVTVNFWMFTGISCFQILLYVPWLLHKGLFLSPFCLHLLPPRFDIPRLVSAPGHRQWFCNLLKASWEAGRVSAPR